MKQLRELSLAQMGLTLLRRGELSGLASLEKLDLTGNRIKTLPESLPSELGSLKSLRLELTLFAQLPDSLLNPLLERPGFTWEIPYPAQTCGRYEPTAREDAPSLSTSDLERVLHLSPDHGQVEVRAWKARKNVYLVSVVIDTGELELFAVSMGVDDRLSLLARAEHPITLGDEYGYKFDLAPYRLTGNEIGFGLRRSRGEPVLNNQTAEEEELQVFRIHGSKLERVLKTVVYRQYTREGPPPGFANDNDVNLEDWQWEERSCSVLAVARSKTNDVFNWVKVSSAESSQKGAVQGGNGGPLPAVVFRWNGERYEAKDDKEKSCFFGED
ncbi:leucine-rich repeat domain-containing protein [Archangium minus]|uniref:Leucine-rich repeat domain-containing protein n=1 Tax=Archangium minus TaxID=83450 RepID=A0ABY9WJP9_9BACT|nr:leucine-rich repeat domain-containing protein [Archangium minus]